MAKNQLSQEEIEKLLKMLKKSLVNSVNFPQKGKTEKFEVKSFSTNDLFSVCIYRGKVNRDKYNIEAIIEKNRIPIMELHIGSTNRHTNPDGTVIEGNHWHIYSEKFGRAQAFIAEDLDNDRFVENTIQFLERFNVIDKPEVYLQESL